MRISLIGMSNIGKTYWARRLATDYKLEHINCDALIERKLGTQLTQRGYQGLQDIAKWMGQPADSQYKENSGQYIAMEKQVMHETFDRLHTNPTDTAVIDTTGSVIYTGTDILEKLRERTRIIYLEASEAHIDYLFRHYIENPKPVIWGDAYAPLPDETSIETLKRCYPDLLRERAHHYRELAHVTIPFEHHRNHKATTAALLSNTSK